MNSFHEERRTVGLGSVPPLVDVPSRLDIDDGVFPIHADARSLPFATEFFDAVVSIDSFVYYGTDDLYLNYLARFLKPRGVLGIAGAGLMQEIEGAVPDHSPSVVGAEYGLPALRGMVASALGADRHLRD